MVKDSDERGTSGKAAGSNSLLQKRAWNRKNLNWHFIGTKIVFLARTSPCIISERLRKGCSDSVYTCIQMKETNLRTEGTETCDKDSLDERLVLVYTVLRQNLIGNHRWASFHPSSLLTRACLYGHWYHPSPLLKPLCLYGARSSDRTATFCPSFLNDWITGFGKCIKQRNPIRIWLDFFFFV